MLTASTSPSTSFSLVQRVRQRDPDAWNAFSVLYSPLVYRWARRWGLQSEDSADVLQNVFVSVFRGVERFDHNRPGASFRGWLWTITRNAVREHVRKRRAEPPAAGGSAVAQQLSELPDLDRGTADQPDDQAFDGLTHRALDVVRGRAAPQVWDAFWRTTVGGESAPEAAAALGMTATAVRQAKYRVLCQLRDLLSDH
jgi:RNA polymerase sigma-70 factor (ECF subfamily)